MCQDALACKSNQEMAKTKVDGFGAIGMGDDPDGFLLVQWKTLPYTTQEPTLTFGNNEPIPAGEVFAEATIWERIPSNPGWYQPPDYTGPSQTRIDKIWMGFVIKGEVVCRKSNEQNGPWPDKPSFISNQNKMFNSTGLRKLFPTQIDLIQTEIASRDGLEYFACDEEEKQTPQQEQKVMATSR